MQKDKQVAFSFSDQKLSFWLTGLLLALYAVGIGGTLWPYSKPLFLWLTPFFLVINLICLFTTDARYKRNPKRFLSVALSVFVLGWAVEWLGVHTGFPFGNYAYGEVLGLKFDGIPFVIGVNWVLLTLSATAVLSAFNLNFLSKAAICGLMITALDVLIEPVAIRLGYWHWFGQLPPIQNYLSWLIIGSIFCTIWLHIMPEKGVVVNPLGMVVLVLQALFFGTLLVFL